MSRLTTPFADITDQDLKDLLAKCPTAWQGDQGFQNWCLELVNLASGPAAAPAITSITPDTVAAGASDTVIAIAGTAFASGAVAVTTADLVTIYESDTNLSATIPAAELAAAGTLQVTVRNPDSQVSAAVAFTVT